MKNLRFLILLVLPLFIVTSGCQKEELVLSSDEELDSPQYQQNYNTTQHDLKIVSQNVGWLTDPIGGFDGHWQDMADWLWQNRSDADVIVIQEAFSSEIELFQLYYNGISNNKYNWTNIDKAQNGFFDKGHGVVILSRFPILEEFHLDYDICHGDLFSCGTDCLADKGIVRVTLGIGFGKKAYVIGTHMDADDCTGDKIARYDQMQFIDNYITTSSMDQRFPLLIVGDLNINSRKVNNVIPNTEPVLAGWSFNYNYNVTTGGMIINHHYLVPDYGSNYKYMKAILNSWASWADGPADNDTDFRATTPDGKLLDYIMVRNDFNQPINQDYYDYAVSCTPADVIHKYTDHCNVSHDFTFSITVNPVVDPNAECANNGDCASDEICIGGECIPL